MDQAAIIRELDDCLVDPPASGLPDWSAWSRLPDPFPERFGTEIDGAKAQSASAPDGAARSVSMGTTP
jgi:hypothetical protein